MKTYLIETNMILYNLSCYNNFPKIEILISTHTIDETQNFSPLEMKTIITRAEKGAKIVLCSDPYQIDTPYLDVFSNSLTYTAQKSVERL